MKTLILLYILGCSTLVGYTQSNNQNLQKYWQYRYFLKNYYLSVGSDAGMSLPAEHRMKEGFRINWFENPVTQLGHYIGVLSTEYKLLKDNNQNTSETVKELFYALYAFNRLDMAGDYLWGGDCLPTDACSLNGFFIRDDVPPSDSSTFFVKDHPELNHGLDSVNDIFAYNTNQKLNRLYYVSNYYSTSEFTIKNHAARNKDDLGELYDPNNEDKKIGLELSADEVLGLFEGLSLLAKCVPSGVTYYNAAFQDGESDILKEAQNITIRIMDWITQRDDWMIVRPNGDQANTRVSGLQKPRFMNYSYPLNIMAANILGISHKNTDYYEKVMNRLIWQSYQELGNYLGFCAFAGICNEFAVKFLLQLATMSNSWHVAFINTTFRASNNLASYFQWNTYYSLYHHVLHGGNSNDIIKLESQVLDQLNNAPCVIPNSDAGNKWSSKYRWGATLKEQEFDGSEEDGFGEKDRIQGNGLDYMLLHNLYYLTYGEGLPKYNNFMDEQIVITFPLNLNGLANIGSTIKPYTVGAFNSINANNSIKAVAGNPTKTAHVTFRAGKEITLKPGFNVEAGAEFYALINPYECGSDGLYRSENTVGLYGMETIEAPNNFVPIIHTNNDAILTEEIEQAKQNEVAIYPNPTQNEFTIYNGSVSGNWQVTIVDVRGRKMYSSSATNEYMNINTKNWKKGVYIVEIERNKVVLRKKLVIN